MGKKGDIIGLEFLVLTFIYTLGGVLMSHIAIKDIYAGMPDAKDEINTKQADKFFASFVIPPALPIDELLNGTKFIVSGYKGVGKTSVLYYLQDRIRTQDSSACTSFIYFKSDFEEVKKTDYLCICSIKDDAAIGLSEAMFYAICGLGAKNYPTSDIRSSYILISRKGKALAEESSNDSIVKCGGGGNNRRI